MGDVESREQVQLLSAEGQSLSSVKVGASKKDRKYTGLIES